MKTTARGDQHAWSVECSDWQPCARGDHAACRRSNPGGNSSSSPCPATTLTKRLTSAFDGHRGRHQDLHGLLEYDIA